ncbi:hypothetical protein TEA_003595 [Camellia sinensis var. sinensis]|uniref:Pectinesterase n=1 Tax=Camellia sinensis var. sinensis TaxID=542762 RepID=A0A4S4D3S5_CAMSN|nr:hypothetical protein TEA_003595 [Camellia sinensis var. sinensis]
MVVAVVEGVAGWGGAVGWLPEMAVAAGGGGWDWVELGINGGGGGGGDDDDDDNGGAKMKVEEWWQQQWGFGEGFGKENGKGIDGVGFIARGITFRNTAGPQNGQAVALRSASDLSVFYACGFEGYQDTLFVLAQRQFFKSCYIYGTIDFIFGNAAVVFQNCIIYVRKPLVGQDNVITAQGRGDPFQNTGISIQDSRVMAAPDLRPVVSSFNTYLGRPWQQYSRTVFLKTYLGSLVNTTGWLAWDNSNFAQNTVYYGEYMNFGPASSTRNRVNWPGYHVITSTNIASQFTVTNLIDGRGWLPATGVPFIAGL